MSTLKLIGIFLIVGGCGSCGFAMAGEYRRLEACFRQTVSALEIIQCEIQYRLTPVPEVCRILTRACTGPVGAFFEELGRELALPDAGELYVCAGAAASRVGDLPPSCRQVLLDLCSMLGRYDVEGQLVAIVAAKEACTRNLEEITAGQADRMKSYKALGLCGGAALAILLL